VESCPPENSTKARVWWGVPEVAVGAAVWDGAGAAGVVVAIGDIIELSRFAAALDEAANTAS